MEQFLAILVVVTVAALFYGVSILKKRKLTPLCDRFAFRYCELADQMLNDRDCKESLRVEARDGGLLGIRPLAEQPEAIQAILKKPVEDSVLDGIRELFFLRDEIQSQASNGNFSKDRYNAITNQLFNSFNAYLSVISDQTQTLSQKDLDEVHYFLQKQSQIRNVALPSIVSRDCAAKIAI